MAGMGKFSAADLKKLKKSLNKLQDEQVNAFLEACAKELAARLLAKVIKRTPVGDYSEYEEVTAKKDSKNHKKGEKYLRRVKSSTGKMGGTLRRGWTSRTHEEAEKGSGTPDATMAAQYAQSLKINHTGNNLVIEIVNPVEYASYVEYGHRQTPGRYVPAYSHYPCLFRQQSVPSGGTLPRGHELMEPSEFFHQRISRTHMQVVRIRKLYLTAYLL